MPLKSKAQQRFMFAAEDRGELEPGTARRWAHHTRNIKNLPDRVKKASTGLLYNDLTKELSKKDGATVKNNLPWYHWAAPGPVPIGAIIGITAANISRGLAIPLGAGLLSAATAHSVLGGETLKSRRRKAARGLLRLAKAKAKQEKYGSVLTLAEELYAIGKERSFNKKANSYNVGDYPPSHYYQGRPEERSLYEKFLIAKHRTDPYSSLLVGGALGALAGATKGKLMAGIGGGLGAMAGHSLAKKD